MRLWDPFCGSGTIGLQYLSMLLDTPIRMDLDTTFMQRIPVFPGLQYDSFKADLTEQFKASSLKALDEYDFKVVFSDVSYKAVCMAHNNFEESYMAKTLEKLVPKWSPVEGAARRVLAPHLREFEHWGGRVRFTTADFEGAGRLLEKETLQAQDAKWTIVCNLPYAGRRSGEDFDALYTRFAKFLRASHKFVDECYVFVELPHGVPRLPKNHFLKVAGLCWNVVTHLNAGGLQIALLQFDRERSQEVSEKRKEKQIVRFDSLVRVQDAQVVEGLPRYLQPQEYLRETALAVQQEKAVREAEKREQRYKDFDATRYLVDSIRVKLGREIVQKMRPVQLRGLIHRRRQEAVRRAEMNRFLTQRSKYIKGKQKRELEGIRRARMRKAKTIVQGALDKVPKSKQTAVFEKVQAELQKKELQKHEYIRAKKK